MVSYSVFGHLTEPAIFVKTSPAGRPIKISELEDLDHHKSSRKSSNNICIPY